MQSEDTIIQEDGFGFSDRRLDVNSGNKSFTIVRRYIMTNKKKASVHLISLGAGIQSIKIPNSRGILGDVVLGFDDTEGYLKNRNIGRIINSVANNAINKSEKNHSDLETDGEENDRPVEKLHNFDNVNWESYVSGQQVIMSYVTRARENKEFGNMLLQAKYSWTDNNELNVNIRATATETQPANLTVCCPMNLAGHATGPEELKNHLVTINSDNFFATKPRENWSNQIRKVDDTFYDLRKPTKMKDRLCKIPGGGYDHNMRINSPSNWCYRFHGRIIHPESGRFLEIYSNKAILKFSTLNDFPDPELNYPPDLEDYMWGGCGDDPDIKSVPDKTAEQRIEIRGKDGALYRRHGGFVASPQNYANEKPIFPNCILRPGQVFVHDMSYKFGVKSKN